MHTHPFRWFLLPIAFFLFSLHASPTTIYVQASPGSFNHQALELLLQESISNYHIQFCGTPENTLKQAAQHSGLAFCALHNTTIPGNYVHPTLVALETYRIARLHAMHSLKIEMALIQHNEGINFPLTYIASHPAALLQASQWKASHADINEIPIVNGTAEAARMLSHGELDLSTAILGSKNLVGLYPNLVVMEQGIQDREDNYTTFILFEPAERPTPLREDAVQQEIRDIRATIDASLIIKLYFENFKTLAKSENWEELRSWA